MTHTKHVLRDPKTGRFIKNRSRKLLEVSYAIGLLKTNIYAVCLATFMGVIAAVVVFLQIQRLKEEVREHKAAAIEMLSSSSVDCFDIQEEPAAIPAEESSNEELLGGLEILVPETEKPRSLIRVIRSGQVSYE